MRKTTADLHKDQWFYEGNISRIIVEYLKKRGYKILKDNSDNCSMRGEDIIAENQFGHLEIVEVKGYPSELLIRGEKRGQTKAKGRTTQQSKHWFSEILLSCLMNYARHKTKVKFTISMGFPALPQYEKLLSQTKDFFVDHQVKFKFYFVSEDGSVITHNLERPVETGSA